MFTLLPPRFRTCSHCKGTQYWDDMDKCWVCLQCARRNYFTPEIEEEIEEIEDENSIL